MATRRKNQGFTPSDSQLLRTALHLMKAPAPGADAPSIPEGTATSLYEPLVKLIDEVLRRDAGSLPARLRPLRNWHRQAARRSMIAKYLSENQTDGALAPAYERWLDSHGDLADACRSGALFDDDSLREGLQESSARDTACTILALGLGERPEWTTLLVLLAQRLSRAERATPQRPSSDPPLARPPKGRAASTAAGMGRSLEAERRNVGRLKGEIEKVRGDNTGLGLKLDRAGAKVKQLDQEAAASAKRERDGNSKLQAERRRREAAEKKLKSSDAKGVRLEERVESVEELVEDEKARAALLKTALEQSERDLSEIPRGLDAARGFISAEIADGELRANTSEGGGRNRLLERARGMKKVQADLEVLYPSAIESTRKIRGRGPREAVVFRSLGGGTEVGASCYLLRIGETELLVDAGIRVKSRKIADMGPDLSCWDNEDPAFAAVLLTHAHTDHIGWLPHLVSRWDFDIHCTPETQSLAGVMLEDCFKQMQRVLQEEAIHAESTGEPIPEAPYERRDVETVLRHMKKLELETPRTIGDVTFRFLRAGHILGAASILLEGGGRRVLLTGDYATYPQETVFGVDWSEAETGEIDLVVSEATYGAPRVTARADVIQELLWHLKHTISQGGSVLIASFALGRAQEILSIIKRAFERGELPPFPVWIDGMIDAINPIYERAGSFELHETFRRRQHEGYEIADVVRSLHATPGAVVTTSGMLAGGPVVAYAEHMLADPKNRLVLVGYQDGESPGGKLIRDATATDGARRRLEITQDTGRTKVIRLGTPALHLKLSAHSDQEEMVEALTRIRPGRVVLIHGEDQNRRQLADALRARGLSVEEAPEIELPAE